MFRPKLIVPATIAAVLGFAQETGALDFEFAWPRNIVEWATAAVGVFFFGVGVRQFVRWLRRKRSNSGELDET